MVSDNAELTSFLIEKGIDVNASDEEGITALALCGIFGRLANARVLLANGARLNDVFNQDGASIFNIILQGAVGFPDAKKAAADGDSEAQLIVRHINDEHVELALLMLEYGAVLDDTSGSLFMPLCKLGYSVLVNKMMLANPQICGSAVRLSRPFLSARPYEPIEFRALSVMFLNVYTPCPYY